MLGQSRFSAVPAAVSAISASQSVERADARLPGADRRGAVTTRPASAAAVEFRAGQIHNDGITQRACSVTRKLSAGLAVASASWHLRRQQARQVAGHGRAYRAHARQRDDGAQPRLDCPRA